MMGTGPIHSTHDSSVGLSEERPLRLRPRLLVSSIGTDWLPGVREGIDVAVQAFQDAGGEAGVQAIGNLCIIPYMALEAMRNYGIMMARQWRMDYILLIENDVLITDPKTLVKLVTKGCPIISPYFDQTELIPPGVEKAHTLYGPMYKANQGLKQVDWTVRSCVLFDCRVFDRIGERPFIDVSMYDVDRYHGLYFQRCGVDWFMDTDTSVKLLRYPSPAWEFDFSKVRPPKSISWEDLRAESEQKRRWFQEAQEAKKS